MLGHVRMSAYNRNIVCMSGSIIAANYGVFCFNYASLDLRITLENLP
jgi:hypothetical protein